MKDFVRDTSIRDTRGAQSAPIPAGEARRTRGATSERDRSGTTEATEGREGDGADSPTRARQRRAKRLALMQIKN